MFDTKKIHRTLEKIQKDIENHELDNYGLPWWDDKRVEDVDALVKDLIELRDVHGFTSQGMNEWLVLLEYAQAAYHKGINREKAETELKKRDPKEIKRLNYFLKKLVNDIKIFETEGTGMLILENHNFPIEKYPEAAQFMAHHPGDLKKMNQAAGDNAGKLFQYGLPKVVGAGLVTEKYWPGLIKMAQAAGDNAWKLFQYGLPKVVGAGLVTEKYWPEIVKGLIEMAQAAGDNTDSLYWFGLPMVVEAGLVTEENWDKLVKLVKILSKNLDKKNIQNLFHKTLSQFILFHKVVDVNTIGDFTVAVVNKYGKGHQQISKIFKELVPLVESNEDLELLWSYLKISSVISFNLFKEYKNLDEKNRKAFLEDHKKRYSDIVLG
ncbi:MAG: hypothetical protein QF632_00805, partial [Candidatus Woesearchaeota archaeon]|nr:hypothetical protein [Candidatus Woesearchaeota archaeon]